MSRIVYDVLNMLEVFCKNCYPIGITELSNILLEGKSSIFKNIKILEELEYIEQDQESKKYRLTTKLVELVNESLKCYYGRTNIEKYLKTITEKTGESCYFGIKNKKNRIVYVDKYLSDRMIAINTNIGDTPLPHCTAHGKALLAFLDIEIIEEEIKNGLQKFTENTITDRQKLLEELRKIREQGYATDEEEREKGFRCIAAPVFNSKKEVIGAIGISGTTQSLTEGKIKEYATIIKEVANKVSINVGNEALY
ncbi:MAG: IclR family transcriptional regulator [Actinobacteria bacterium]|nr:IclR family transcriptional regulator [Actinomycetota bacterium]